MHGLRRRLSEPEWPAIGPPTDPPTSALHPQVIRSCAFSCVAQNTHTVNQKKQGENRACGKLEKGRIYSAILGFATETSLALPLSSVNGDQNPRKDGAKGELGSLSSTGRAAPDERLS